VIRYIKPVPSRSARGVVQEVYRQIKGEFGTLGEPLTLHSPLPALLAGLWCSFRESLVAGVARRDVKEAVAVGVSRLNECPYCIDAPAVLLRATRAHEAAAMSPESRT
jgi:AhpD family alkylhydroperoxidase